MGEKVRILKAASVVGLCTFFSRIFGLLRDVVIALIFGAGMQTDAFFVAFRIPNLFRRLVGEGSLTVAFIPVFTRYMETHSKEEVRRFIGSSLYFFSLLLLAITILGVLAAPLLVGVFAPGFVEDRGFQLTVNMTRLLFPYLFFIGLVALSMGILNSVHHFIAPAISPVWLNLSIILSALILTSYLDQPIYALVAGVLVGGVIQLLFQVPFLRWYGFLPEIKAPLTDKAVWDVALLMVPSIIGVGVHQLNILVTTRFASMLPSGSVSYLYYADRLVEFPLGIFGIALSTAALPSMSSQSAREDWDGFRGSLSHSLRLAAFISIPAMVGLMVLRIPLVRLFFERGEFTFEDTVNTATALFYYSVGLFAFSGVKILASAFYALQDTKTPVKVAVLALLTNVVSALLLMGPLGHGGLALATSIASIVNFVLLIYLLEKRIGGIDLKDLLVSICRTILASLTMGICVYTLSLTDLLGDGMIRNGIEILLQVFAGVLIFLFVSYLLKSDELRALRGLIHKEDREM